MFQIPWRTGSLPTIFGFIPFAAIAFFLLISTWASLRRTTLTESVVVGADEIFDEAQKSATYKDPTKGYWSPSEELKGLSRTWEDLPGHLGPHGAEWRCYAAPTPIQVGFIPDDGGLRAEHVEGWQWVIEGGYAVAAFDVEEVVTRALKSRMGFAIIGDSISEQMIPMFTAMLSMPYADDTPLPFQMHLSNFDQYPGHAPVYRNITLSDGHPLKDRLLSREDLAHIPRRRFDEPVLRLFRSDVFVNSTQELVDIVRSVHAGTDVEAFETTRTYAPWLDLIQQYGPEYGDVAWEGELESPVLVNTGAHWDLDRFQPVEPEKLVEVYAAALRKVSEGILKIQGVPLRVFYRPTVAGHENCQDFLDPVPPFHAMARNRTLAEYPFWSWEIFPTFNAIAKERFQGQRGLVKMEYWDVWDMAATRPDAHAAWNGKYADCLHWCPGGMPYWWVRLWWHTLREIA